MKPGLTGYGLALMVLAALLLPREGAAGETPIRQVIRQDVTWDKGVTVDGIVIVAKGARLRIAQGVRVRFAPRDDDGDGIGDSELRVEGSLEVAGTGEEPVVFTSAAPDPQPADWKYIMVNHADGVRMTGAVLEFAYSGVQVHYTRGFFSGIRARRNVDGFRFSTAPVTLQDSELTGNVNGIRFEERGAGAVIRRNLVTGNNIGVFAVIKCRGLTVFEGNLFEKNLDYNVKMGQRQTEDVPMKGNWWGHTDAAAIEETFFDGRVEPELGKVVFEPYLMNRPELSTQDAARSTQGK